MNEINMVPFIDVMLVLLIVFMVSAPLIATSVIDVPSVGQSKKPLEKTVIELVIGVDGRIKLKIDGTADAQAVSADRVAERVKQAQAGNTKIPVVISAERKVAYETVVKVMDKLQGAGVERVALAVKQGG
ncbi:MAG TPA: biopolymer transporter ExbD [Burkholderiaceae bacterium]|nr:biopolymer transporter ExbD [Burkholderiaceae bacterium]